jgi:flavin reductase (DIM6/NTAB) family NADH-FMN oxidoreductase RutF/DNA-binding FadR family transcriptional regulator
VNGVVHAFDSAVFRRVIGNFMSGVVVITTRHNGQNHGATVSAVCSLSMEPPMLLVCLNSTSTTQEAVRHAGRFAVNVLAEHQGPLAERFARSAPGQDKFAGVAVRTGRLGLPLLEGALAVIECRVAEVVTGGTHRVFMGEVMHAEAGEGSPLAYFRGKFGRLEMAQDEEVFHQIRRLVISRAFGPGEALAVEQVAEQLGASPSSVYYALTRLVGENLIFRDPERGYVVRPLDVATSDDTNDAKLAIELGVADLTVGRLTSEQVAEFRRLAQRTGDLIRDGQFVDLPGYIAANEAFHSYMVKTTGVAALVEAYERLSLSELMARALTPDVAATPHLVQDHLELVEAYERADLDAVKRVITAHNERAKATQRAGIQRAGGEL